MAVIQLPNTYMGQTGILPAIVPMVVTDNYATVVASGYLNSLNVESLFTFSNSNILYLFYGYVDITNPGTFGIFSVVNSGGIFTLVEYTSTSGVNALVLPTTSGQIASYGDTNGDITQGQTNISNLFGNISAGTSGTAGAFVANPNTAAKGAFVFQAADQAGNTTSYLNNGAFGQATVVTIPDPGAATANVILNKSAGTQTISSGNLAVSAGTISASGNISSSAGAITASGNITSSAGSLISGASGTAGAVTVYPATAANGTFTFEATNQGGNFASFLTNAAFAQGTTLTLTDPAAATGKVPVFTTAQIPAGASQILLSADTTGRLVSSGVQFIVATTATYGGGTTNNVFAAPGLTSAWKVVPVTSAGLNGGAIIKCIAGTDTLDITWDADPGSNTTVTYIAFSAAYAP